LKNEKMGNNQIKVEFDDNNSAKVLFGEHDANLKTLERLLNINIVPRGNSITITGSKLDSNSAKSILNQLYTIVKQGHPVFEEDIEQAVRTITENANSDLKEIFSHTVLVSSKNNAITPKSRTQKIYVDTMKEYDIVLSIGPAGTGKTYLAMAMAVALLSRGDFERIVLARPAVEAGEKLGFLPGDLYEKVNPYLRPLYDALYDMMSVEKANRLVEKGTIEVAPLAFMRGRTLNNSFVILDEAQNTTSEQMKMFLTRLGLNSKAVITGDITQIDLPAGQKSGLVEVTKILKDIEGIAFVHFNEQDVVRHRLVKEIIKAYEKNSKAKKGD